jgi:hypothetical protein
MAAPILPLLEALPKARQVRPGAWAASCPAHEDHNPSLSWAVNGDGHIGVKCFAGCSAEAIVGALGEPMSSLFAPKLTNGHALGVAPHPAKPKAGAVVKTRRFAATDTSGRIWAHERHEDATGRAVGDMKWQAGVKLATLQPYGSELVASWPAEDPVFVVEGEATAEALRARGLPALGTYGVTYKPDPAALAALAGRRVILWPDADDVGRAHMLDMATRLDGIAGALRWIEPPAGVFRGWDAADADAETVARLVSEAGPVLAPDTAEKPVAAFPEPEDRGTATLSPLGAVEYVEDIARPGRIVVWAAEEGAGKSYTVDGELGIRVAVAGGSLAGTWPILKTGPVLVLSEMHPDDDFGREETILPALGLDRSALTGRYYRLPLMTAAGGPPALTVPEWRAWITDWLREHGALLLIIDTATGATQVDPWGQAIQAVYRDLRAMLEAYPELAVVLLLHLKKPQGRGERRISDVLGEWGRWCDVVVLQEQDGTNRTKLSTSKRVRHMRRISATRSEGLLIDPVDLDEMRGQKVPEDAVLAAIVAQPGISFRELGAALDVSKDTAARYVKALGSRATAVPTGPKGAIRVYLADEAIAAPPQTTAGTGYGSAAAVDTTDAEQVPPHRRSTYIGAAVPAAVVRDDSATVDCADYSAHQSRHRQTADGWICDACRAVEASA